MISIRVGFRVRVEIVAGVKVMFRAMVGFRSVLWLGLGLE